MSVNGGWIDTSATLKSSVVSRYASFCTARIASKWSRFIFQLPLMSGLRSPLTLALLHPERRQAGKVAELEQLQRRAAAGRDPVHARRHVEPGERGRAVAAADHREGLRVDDSLRDRARPGREAIVFEHTHGAVPEHGAGVEDDVREL